MTYTTDMDISRRIADSGRARVIMSEDLSSIILEIYGPRGDPGWKVMNFIRVDGKLEAKP